MTQTPTAPAGRPRDWIVVLPWYHNPGGAPRDEQEPGSRRMQAFDRGEDPLPASSTPLPRATGWEREWQH